MSRSPEVHTPIGATLTIRQKLALMYVLMLTMFLTALDQSIVATAVPRIVADLQGFELLPWVFTIYVLTSTVTIPPIGKLSDMFGRKRFLLAGIAIFVAASAACGAAPSMVLLIVARAVQGVGAGIIVACVFAALGDLFTPVERAKYFPLFIGMFTIANLTGPTVGGFLTDGFGWRWCFYINLPVGILATLFIATRFPAEGGNGGRFSQVDFAGTALLGIATTALLLMIEWGQREFGWSAAQTIGLGVTAALFTLLFLAQERRHPFPIIPLSLFRNVPFVQAILITLCFSSMIFTAGQFLPTFLQISLGTTARESGLITTPQGLGVFISGLVTGQLISRTGRYRMQMIVGAAGLIAVTWFTRQFDVDSPRLTVAGLLMLTGLTSGLVMPVTQVIMQGAVSQGEQGVASSARQFFLQVAQVMGLAILGLIFTTSYGSGFASATEGFADALPPAAYATLHEDPTVSMDPERFEEISTEIRAQPDGDALLERTLAAQREGVAHGIQNVLTMTFGAAVAILLVCLGLREISLRREFDSHTEVVAVEV